MHMYIRGYGVVRTFDLDWVQGLAIGTFESFG